jgi:hypothetical protein
MRTPCCLFSLSLSLCVRARARARVCGGGGVAWSSVYAPKTNFVKLGLYIKVCVNLSL